MCYKPFPTYTISVFKLPIKLCKGIEDLFARFWGCQNKKEICLNWKRWNKICASKKMGGMRFK